ncbi:LysR family transcriptional regulator [Azorhizobium oxalatiphilum]|uniref:LysR family transcriptional regulator n=1 Tax=Azorhizobium oxalatiphilum TaxID=980631 RepID=A0A917C7R3_9HYPH|nr:LysR substrate-binding domain-containing protein [Azorhizobium oxalatiphilum]GGF76375.1 LysR family transcriptional regulator [Azorhizobium oxalatiphilum]
MLDLDLLHAFVSVVDAGGFTRAGERVHRTQSTVSQQIRRLEAATGRPLFARTGRQVQLTEDGERLLGYARRILALSAEAKAAMAREAPAVVLRLGMPDDVAVAALTRTVAAFATAHPDVRLAVRCGLSLDLAAGLERGDLDVALMKREPGRSGARASWREDLVWVAAASAAPPDDPVPLVAFPHGCLYRNRAIDTLERAGRPWRIAYECPNLVGIQAAVDGGLGVALLEKRALLPGQRVLGPESGLPHVPASELALCLRRDAPPVAEALADVVAAFCADPQMLARAA